MSELPLAVLFDLDGTLLDNREIQHLVAPSHPDYTGTYLETYHGRSMFCPPRHDVFTQLEAHRSSGKAVVVLTARPQRVESVTRTWLDTHVKDYAGLYMRPDWHQGTAVEWKLEALVEIRARWRVAHAWDDNPHVVKAFRQVAGLPTVFVPGWLP